MFSNSLYYTLKPYIPRSLRLILRQMAARGIRPKCDKSWPILPAAGRIPKDWPGWPEGKKFAFLLTHDVEGPEGLAQVRHLAEVEMELGFRSSFNFIPDGTYEVPTELREWLLAQGFEVGIHDLHHDGKLFTSRAGFAAKAKRINRYLSDWGAVGFRAGFMLRNLEWYHDLNIKYDASTFDTDPFEPMPDGAETIFPFWIPYPHTPTRAGQNGSGYVELPYTLPQDSTLYLVLQEPGPGIWLRKFDWVAAQSGMALLNVHPDYIDFNHGGGQRNLYPIEHYTALLRHARDCYANQFWQPLPRQLAAWFVAAKSITPINPVTQRSNQTVPAPNPGPLRGKRAAVILYSNYPADPRPRRAAEAMIEAGMTVDLLCLSQSDDDLQEETVRGVHVFRHPMKRKRSSVFTYLWQYSRFCFASFLFLLRHGLVRKYDIVHVHNMPDFLVFSALLSKLRGARLILDLHDPSPELMVTIFGLHEHHWVVRVLRLIEQWSIGLSDLVLTPNIAFKNLFTSRSCRAEKIQIVMNSPQPDIFGPDRFPPGREGIEDNGEFRVMHHGLIAHRHGIDLLVEAIARLQPKIPGLRLDIYGGTTPFLDTVLETAKKLNVDHIVRYHGAKSQDEIATAIRHCHVGVVPNRRSIFTEINFPTRLFEYLALQRPVVAPNTQGIRDYFKSDEIIFFDPENVEDLSEKIFSAYSQRATTEEIVARGVAVYRQHLWPEQKWQLIDSFIRLLPATTS